jgi:serine/threonine-protein kinase
MLPALVHSQARANASPDYPRFAREVLLMAGGRPSRNNTDKNLLFGVLALQMDFISRDALVTAMNAWVLQKSRALGEILREQGALAADTHALLEGLVQKHLALHGNDAEKSLAAVAVSSVREQLQKVADPDVHASLMHLAAIQRPPQPGADPYATRAHTVGAPSAVGQRFRILRPYAKGGLGEVYVARDQELQRDVALKQIQDAYADNPESRARFVAEAEITGGLEHPGIVPVYGLGHYAQGRPFYAMRFIRGDSLKEAIEQFHKKDVPGRDLGGRTLELHGLLRRFVDVCNAISYAHSRGVLHRDLKPGNVMLGSYGETLVVDWGLAKPIDKLEGVEKSIEGLLKPASLSPATATLAGSALGTPQYMSPEQAAGRLNELGPATDVYSLGATLYCLLTGKAPVDDPDLGTLLRRVQRGDFAPPRLVDRKVPAALEAVCLKAMALAPADRYRSPRDLADDIEHWLADEPVSAWREPWTVRARRWLGRHRTLVTGTAAAVLMAIVLLTGATVLLTKANQRERLAKEEANAQRDEVQRQKERAEQNYQLARKAVDRYHTEVSENVLLREPGMEPLRKKLLEAAREFYDKFVEQRTDDPDARAELGRALFRLAQLTGDIDSEIKAIDLYKQALTMFAGARGQDPESGTSDSVKGERAGTSVDLATCYHHLGRLYRLTDHLEQAEDSYHQALAVWEQLDRSQPGTEVYQAGLARSKLGLGNVYQVTRRLDRARDVYNQALAIRETLARQHTENSDYQRDLAVTYNNLAMVSRATGQANDAETAYGQALKIQERLVHEFPSISQYQNDQARTYYNLGDLRFQAGQKAPAEESYRAAADVWTRLVRDHSAVTNFQTDLGEAYAVLASVYRAEGQNSKAEDAGRQALAIKLKLAADHPSVPSYQADLARCQYRLGDIYRSAGSSAKAEASYRDAAAIQEKLSREYPKVPQYQADLARTDNNLGLLHFATGRLAEGEADFRKALDIWEKLAQGHGEELEFSLGLSTSYGNLGNVLVAAGKLELALQCHSRAISALAALPPDKQKQSSVKQASRNAYRARAETLTQVGRYQEALQDWDRAIELGGEDQLWLRLQRARTIAGSGDYSRATAEAGELAKKATGSGEALYQLARVYCLSATAVRKDGKMAPVERRKLADQFLISAIDLLKKAAQAGYFKTPANREKLRNDPDLEPLRPRPELNKLLEG